LTFSRLRTLPLAPCFRATPTPDLYTLSLHDALPISIALHPRIGLGDDQLDRCGQLDADDLAVEEGDLGGHLLDEVVGHRTQRLLDRKSTRLNSSHVKNSYAVFCLKKKKT